MPNRRRNESREKCAEVHQAVHDRVAHRRGFRVGVALDTGVGGRLVETVGHDVGEQTERHDQEHRRTHTLTEVHGARQRDQPAADDEHDERQGERSRDTDLVAHPTEEEHGEGDAGGDRRVNPARVQVAQADVFRAVLAEDGQDPEVDEPLDDVGDVDSPQGLRRLDECHESRSELAQRLSDDMADGLAFLCLCGVVHGGGFLSQLELFGSPAILHARLSASVNRQQSAIKTLGWAFQGAALWAKPDGGADG